MLYREGHQSFSDRERALLQRITPFLTARIRDCRMLSEVAGRGQLLEELFRHQGTESIVLAPPSTEVMRTAHATALLEKWFEPHERRCHGLPQILVEQLARLVDDSGAQGRGVPDSWNRTGLMGSLKVTFVRLPEHAGRKLWALMLQEVAHGRGLLLPSAWRKGLTPRQVEVVEGVLRGWDNQLIAEHLGCSLATVKKHLQHIFDKLGVSSRTALLSMATRH
jgi:DNA-binding CsgD family transcriptional regulator